jgi:predicted nucleic acid-binding protein
MRSGGRRRSPLRVVVDTSVWSLALRRAPRHLSAAERAIVFHWSFLVREGLAVLVGTVRQEILTGIRTAEQFERVREHLRGFDDEPLAAEDHERAAQFANTCLAEGIAGSPADFLLCAVASGRDLPLFTTDPDFTRYARHVPLLLHRRRR